MSAKFFIPINKLRELYIQQSLSSRKIGKILGVTYSTVDRKIREYGLPIRSLAAAHTKTHRRSFDGDALERSYLIGFRIGDLRARRFYKNSETIKIDCGSTRRDQIDHIKNMFKKYGHIWIGRPTIQNKIQIECHVDLSFSFLLEKYAIFPEMIISSKDRFLSCLAGFTDAEGCFMIPSNPNRVVFTIGNYQIKLLEQIKDKLGDMGFSVKIYLGTKKGRIGSGQYKQREDYWHLNIHRKDDLLKFINLITPYLRYKRKISDAVKVKRILESRIGSLRDRLNGKIYACRSSTLQRRSLT